MFVHRNEVEEVEGWDGVGEGSRSGLSTCTSLGAALAVCAEAWASSSGSMVTWVTETVRASFTVTFTAGGGSEAGRRTRRARRMWAGCAWKGLKIALSANEREFV